MTPQDIELTTSQLGNHFVTAAAETVQDTGKIMSNTNKMIDRSNMTTKLSFYSIKDPERSRLLTMSLR